MDSLKALATKALDYVPDGCRIGLGSGHTTESFVQALGERVRAGLRISAVPTSEATAELARNLGIPLAPLGAEELDLTMDGADEVEQGTLNLIKGWGGALFRERIVAAASRRQIILVTGEKLVERLGSRGKLPVEVLPFAAWFCQHRLEQMAGMGIDQAVLRGGAEHPFVTDNGNWIFDCAIPPQHEPSILERALVTIPGVVGTGLFLGTADLVLVGDAGSVTELRRPE